MQKRKITSILICALLLFGLMTPAALADEPEFGVTTTDNVKVSWADGEEGAAVSVAWQDDMPSAISAVDFYFTCPPGFEVVKFEPAISNVISTGIVERDGKYVTGVFGEGNSIRPSTDGSLLVGYIIFKPIGAETNGDVTISKMRLVEMTANNEDTKESEQNDEKTGSTSPNPENVKPVVISNFNVPLASASSAFMKGDPGGTIRPNGTLTRAELAQMLYNLYGNNRTDLTASFSDVEMGLWYSIPIAFCQANGYMKGDAGATTFRPNDTLTRAELATTFVNLKSLTLTPSHPFTDVAGDHWGREYIGAAYAAGLMKGDAGTTNFRPNDRNTRAEAVVVICNAEGRDYTQFDTVNTFSDLTPGTWYYPYMMHAANGYSN